jgi:RNA polymerase sigma-54 factor
VLAQQIPQAQVRVAHAPVAASSNGHKEFVGVQPEDAAAMNGAASSIGVLPHGSNASVGENEPETNGHKPATEYSPALKRDLEEALHIVRRFDPVGIAARDLRECLLTQLDVRTQQAGELAEGIRLAAAAVSDEDDDDEGDSPINSIAAVESESDRSASERIQTEACVVMALARRIIDEFLPNLLKRDIRELSRFTGSPQPRVHLAIESIRGLDPKPGQRYNREQVRLIEPDVAFQKRDDDYVILINDVEMPTLRLNQGYRRMLSQEGTEREVRDYVKERYRSAIQLMRNIEQRKNTIVRTCEVIVRRQREFLEQGVDSLKPMMIKDVAEEIGVHASTVSRAVANKYVHTPQGVFELRFFFSEGVNGPEGSDTPLLLLKRKVKKMIEDEEPSKPLTDDAIAHLLQSQGIAVNRRTVAKYREDMGIPSTHQRRVRI